MVLYVCQRRGYRFEVPCFEAFYTYDMKPERKYIVTNGGQPMTFQSSRYGDYFYYVGTIRHGSRDAVQTYTKAEANRLIRLANKDHEMRGETPLRYKLMRVSAD